MSSGGLGWDIPDGQYASRRWGAVSWTMGGTWTAHVLPPDAAIAEQSALFCSLRWRHSRGRRILAELAFIGVSAAALSVFRLVVANPPGLSERLIAGAGVLIAAAALAVRISRDRSMPDRAASTRRLEVRRERRLEKRDGSVTYGLPDRPDAWNLILALDDLAVLLGEGIVDRGEWQRGHRLVWDFLSRSSAAREVLGCDALTARLDGLIVHARNRAGEANEADDLARQRDIWDRSRMTVEEGH